MFSVYIQELGRYYFMIACQRNSYFLLKFASTARPCPPPRIDHGSGLGPLNPGELLTVACFPGYVLSNETSVNCVAGGTFSSHLPQCLGEDCNQ